MRRLATCSVVSCFAAWCLLGAGGAGPEGAESRPLAAASAGALTPRVEARNVPFPTNIAFDPRGRIWVTSAAGGPGSDGVWLVPRRGAPRRVASNLTTALGLVWSDGVLYVGHITSASNGRVTALSGFTGRRFRTRRVVLDGLKVGRHTVDSLVEGDGGRLFVGVGSVHDNRGLSGRVFSFDPQTGQKTLEARGLRNPYGLAWWGRRLLVTDNGRDDLGLRRPPEELNAFDPTGPVARFGFPRCYGQGGAACRGSRAPLVRFPAHASTDGLAVRGHFAYVAQNGSSFSGNPTGNDVQCVNLRTRKRRRLWKASTDHDPLGAAIGPDQRLYVTLFRSGRVVSFDVSGGCS